jgi:hypothetical protein
MQPYALPAETWQTPEEAGVVGLVSGGLPGWMRPRTFLLENLEQGAEIGAEKLLEVVRGLLGDEEAIRLQALPVRNGDAKAVIHGRKANPQIVLLAGERDFQNLEMEFSDISHNAMIDFFRD